MKWISLLCELVWSEYISGVNQYEVNMFPWESVRKWILSGVNLYEVNTLGCESVWSELFLVWISMKWILWCELVWSEYVFGVSCMKWMHLLCESVWSGFLRCESVRCPCCRREGPAEPGGPRGAGVEPEHESPVRQSHRPVHGHRQVQPCFIGR